MANSISVAVADSDTMRSGAASRVTPPVSVTGNSSAAPVSSADVVGPADRTSAPSSSPQALTPAANAVTSATARSRDRNRLIGNLLSVEGVLAGGVAGARSALSSRAFARAPPYQATWL